MEKNKHVISAIIITAIVTALLTWSINNYFFYGVTDETTNKFRYAAGIIQKNAFKKLDESELQVGSLKGLIGSLNDSNSVYLSNEEVTNLESNTVFESTGLGMETIKIISGYMVVNVIESSPAQKAGLQLYDIISAINGVDVKNEQEQTITKLLKNKKGDKIQLTILRQKQSLEVEIAESQLDFTPSIKKIHTINGKKVAVLNLQKITAKTPELLNEILKTLDADAVEGVVMDLRNNYGGDVKTAQQIIELLVSNKKPYLQVENRNGEIEKFSTANPEFTIKKPMLVLVNEKTASAAEIIAAALHENEGVQLVGNRTFGKGTIQELYNFNDGSAMKITTKHWLTPNGVFLEEGKGLVPNVLEIDPIPYTISSIGANLPFGKGDRDITGSTTISDVQSILTYFEYNIQRTDGNFDGVTESELKKFQANRQIPTTGNIDQDTLYVINNKLLTYTNNIENDVTLQKALQLLTK